MHFTQCMTMLVAAACTTTTFANPAQNNPREGANLIQAERRAPLGGSGPDNVPAAPTTLQKVKREAQVQSDPPPPPVITSNAPKQKREPQETTTNAPPQTTVNGKRDAVPQEPTPQTPSDPSPVVTEVAEDDPVAKREVAEPYPTTTKPGYPKEKREPQETTIIDPPPATTLGKRDAAPQVPTAQPPPPPGPVPTQNPKEKREPQETTTIEGPPPQTTTLNAKREAQIVSTGGSPPPLTSA